MTHSAPSSSRGGPGDLALCAPAYRRDGPAHPKWRLHKATIHRPAPRMIPSTPRRRLAFGLLLAQLGGSLLLLSSVAHLLVWLLPRQAAVRVGRSAISLIYRRCWASAQRLDLMRIDADALDALRGERGGLILAANHPTMIDAMLVVAHLPESVCVMRADLMRNVFLGPGARLANYIGSRDGGNVVRESVAALRDGHTVVFFPEGTRTSTPPVDAFKPGLTVIA